GAQATKVFLVPVAGNNQRVQPGEVLPEPLVGRLQDQFGNPVVGEAMAMRITRGEGSVIAADATTDAQGEARVRVQAGASDTDLGTWGVPTCPPGVARDGNRLYVGTFVPEHLYVLDSSHPRAPDFAADRDGNGAPDVVLGSVALPTDAGARSRRCRGGSSMA